MTRRPRTGRLTATSIAAIAACAAAATAAAAATGAPALAFAPKPSVRALAQDRSAFFENRVTHASLTPSGSAGHYRLVLRGVPRTMPYYASHPLRVRGRVATGSALHELFAHGSRVAAIERHGAPSAHDALAVRLSRPRYSAASATIAYAATALPKLAAGSGLTAHGQGLDTTLPASLGPTSVYVGAAHDGQYCEGWVYGDAQTVADWNTISSYAKWPTDSWATTPSLVTSGSDGYVNWQSDGEDGDGCHNSVTLSYADLYTNPPTPAPSITLSMTYKIGDKASVDCPASVPAGWATCSYTTSKGGLFDTDLTTNFTIAEPAG